MFTSSVIRNRTSPEAMSAPRPVSVASPKPLAMLAAMLFPFGPSTWNVTVNVAGKISATAMVSPMARPRPSIAALMTPGRPNGSTDILIISQRVAPSASAASSCAFGTWRNTSREIAAMIGRIMMASTSAAVSMLRPTTWSPPNSGIHPR